MGRDTTPESEPGLPDVSEAVECVHRDGIARKPRLFSRRWMRELAEDVDRAFADALSRQGGAVEQGSNRWYVAIHPEALRGFVDLVDHPWVRAVAEAVLGPDYQIAEIGFDMPVAGASNQPWHRDLPSPSATRRERRLTSLAFDVSCVDTEADMGPIEVVPGTHWESGTDFDHEMFPSRSAYPRYEERAVRALPRQGDVTVRSALTLHRGTMNRSNRACPTLVLGMTAPGAGDDAHHDMAVTRGYWTSLPPRVRQHLACPIVEALAPIVQKPSIREQLMGKAH